MFLWINQLKRDEKSRTDKRDIIEASIEMTEIQNIMKKNAEESSSELNQNEKNDNNRSYKR